jgi:hypothetical protein
MKRQASTTNAERMIKGAARKARKRRPPLRLADDERSLIGWYRGAPDDESRYWLWNVVYRLSELERFDRGQRELLSKYPETPRHIATDEERIGWRRMAVAYADQEFRGMRRASEHFKTLLSATAQGGGTAEPAAVQAEPGEPGELATVIPLFRGPRGEP